MAREGRPNANPAMRQSMMVPASQVTQGNFMQAYNDSSANGAVSKQNKRTASMKDQQPAPNNMLIPINRN